MLGFANTLLLVGLVAVGLPVLIHMLTRPRPRVIKYPTFHMLIEAGSGQQALQRLRTLLVLLLRSLLVAALVLVFARPFWRQHTETGPTQAPRVVLLVDASVSMGASEGGVSLFDSARSQAADTLRELEDDAMVGVVLIGRSPRPLLPVLSRNRSALHEQLITAGRSHEVADIGAALDLAAQMLGETGGRVIIFSDFQRTNWGDVDLTARSRLRYVLRPVSDHDAENVGVTALNVTPGIPIVSEKLSLTVTLFNATATKRIETVRLSMDELTMTSEVELRPYSSADTSFNFSIPKPGFYTAQVTLTGDGLPDDDTRYLTLHVRDALRTLLISDADATDPTHAAYFLARALAPSEFAATGIQVAARRPADVDRASLETADLFVLAPPVRLTGETADIIARRVRNGADLLYIIDGPDADDLINALAGASEGLIAPPFTLTRPVQAPASELTFASRQLADPAARLDLVNTTDFSSMRYGRYFMTDNDPARARELLLTHADGSAALSLWTCERGGAVLVNFPITPDSGNIAGNPLFPVLMHETLRAMRGRADAGEVYPGMAWMLDVPSGRAALDEDDGSVAYRVLDPEEQPLHADVVSRGRTDRLALSPAELPGHYRVFRGDQPVEAGVVNINPKESDTRSLNLQLLTEGTGNAVTLAEGVGRSLPSRDHQPLWPMLLLMAALCMTAEMLVLAWWPTATRATRPTTDREVGP